MSDFIARDLSKEDDQVLQSALGPHLELERMKRFLERVHATEPNVHAIIYQLVVRTVELQEELSLAHAEQEVIR